MSAFWKMRESETYNITGYYSLDEIEIDPSSDNFGNVKEKLGIGVFQDWARNKLDATVANFAFHGKYNFRKNTSTTAILLLLTNICLNLVQHFNMKKSMMN